MEELIYGVWKGQVFDNRRRSEPVVPSDLNLEDLVSFNPGNPVGGVIGPHGFLILDNRLTLLELLLHFYKRVTELSCGRCSPCRIGAPDIYEALAAVSRGESDGVDWDRILLTAQQMRDSSLCGIGLTTPVPFIEAMTHFPNLIKEAPLAPTLFQDFYGVATAPCIEACPAHVNVPRYIDYIKDGHPEMATAVLLEHYPLVGSCGRVCVRPCEKACVRAQVDQPVAIKDLKRFAADHAGGSMGELFEGVKVPLETPVTKHVAVVGAGPAGLTCAYHLLRRGHKVDIFESQEGAGGMARLGIPEYRLENGFLDGEADVLQNLGARFYYGKTLGRDFNVSQLLNSGYQAVFLGLGCALGSYLGLPEESEEAPLPEGYLKGLDFLLDVEKARRTGVKMTLEGDVVVVGCGNVAMDCCRTARRLVTDDARVIVSYRRDRTAAPADAEEIEAAIEEGIDFLWQTAPVGLRVENGQLTGLRVVKMQLGEPNASGRRSLIPVPNSEFVIPCTRVIAAVGQKFDESVFVPEDGIELTKRGTIAVDNLFRTSRMGVFAGGDAAAGPTTLIQGMAEGEIAATAIHEYLMTEGRAFVARRRMSDMITTGHWLEDCVAEKAPLFKPRQKIRQLPAAERVKGFEEVELGFTPTQAWEEANRCMRCYRVFGVSTLRPIPGKTALEEN